MMNIYILIIDMFKFAYISLCTCVNITVYKLYGKRTVEDEENIEGKTVVITGGSRGIGKAMAIEFAKRGATIVIGDVDVKEGEKAVEEIQRNTGNKNVELIKLDLSDMESVKIFARTVKERFPEIKILLNNAGIGAAPMGNVKTKDGFNLHVAVNHLGHFLLTNLLLENLKRGSSARVISMSSLMQFLSRLDLNDLMMDKTAWGYGGGLPYCNTKFANALFIKELAKRTKGTAVTTYAVCPGFVRTDIYNTTPFYARIPFGLLLYFFGLSVDEACQGILHCALSKSVKKESGQIYQFKEPFHAVENFNAHKAEPLWTLSAKLVNLDNYSLTSD